jgi:hypothetical protein
MPERYSYQTATDDLRAASFSALSAGDPGGDTFDSCGLCRCDTALDGWH